MTYTPAQSAAWTSGRVAGLNLRGISANPHKAEMPLSDAWEAGYTNGRDETESRRQSMADASRQQRIEQDA